VLIRLAVCLVVGIYSGAMFLAYGLPAIVQRATTEMYGSGEEVENDPMHDARSLVAQGDYAGAIEAYRAVAAEHPDDRFPWIEMSKIQNTNLEDPDAAIATLKEGLEAHEWTVNNAAFFLFRIAGIYEEEKEDMDSTVQLLQQIVELFPETRHSANATHRLRDLGAI
jgi:tetratricopeptide (TPR) repeat protein